MLGKGPQDPGTTPASIYTILGKINQCGALHYRVLRHWRGRCRTLFTFVSGSVSRSKSVSSFERSLQYPSRKVLPLDKIIVKLEVCCIYVVLLTCVPPFFADPPPEPGLLLGVGFFVVSWSGRPGERSQWRSRLPPTLVGKETTFFYYILYIYLFISLFVFKGVVIKDRF